MNSTLFWDVTPCILDYRRFRGTYCLYLLGRRREESGEVGQLRWGWREHVPPKRRWRFAILHGFISQKDYYLALLVQSHVFSVHALTHYFINNLFKLFLASTINFFLSCFPTTSLVLFSWSPLVLHVPPILYFLIWSLYNIYWGIQSMKCIII
jgi:hypothetical protein